MANKTILVEIDPETGGATVDLEGYQGHGCAAVQEVFGRALGTTTHSTKKPEFTRCRPKRRASTAKGISTYAARRGAVEIGPF